MSRQLKRSLWTAGESARFHPAGKLCVCVWVCISGISLQKDTQDKHLCVVIEGQHLALHLLVETGRTDDCGSDAEAVVHCIHCARSGSGHF